MPLIDCEIREQARMVLILPLAATTLAFVVSTVVYLVGRAVGMAHGTAGGIATFLALAGLGLAFWLYASPGARLTFDGERIEVTRRFRAPITVPTAGASVTSRTWFEPVPGVLRKEVAGRILVVRSGGKELAIGARVPGLAADLDPSETARDPLSERPSFAIDEKPFRELAAALGVALPE